MTTPSLGDQVSILYRGERHLGRISEIRGSTMIIVNGESRTSLTYSDGNWLLPGNISVPFTDVFLIKEEANFSFTGHELTDIELLIHLDDKTFRSACRTSKYSQKLCDGPKNNILYEGRIRLHWPEYYDIIKENWKQAYDYITILNRDKGKENEWQTQFNNQPKTLTELRIMLRMYPNILSDPDNDNEFYFKLLGRIEQEKKNDMIIYLIENGYINEDEEESSLDTSFSNDNLELILYLLNRKKGKNLNLTNAELIYDDNIVSAGSRGHVDIVKFFYESPEYSFRFEDMNSYLDLLQYEESLSVLKYLYTKGYDPKNYPDLQSAINSKGPISQDAVEILIWLDSIGVHPTQETANRANFPTMRIIRNSFGGVAEVQRQERAFKILKWLETKGLRPNIPNLFGNSFGIRKVSGTETKI
ncbi:MAG: hypothetical protein Solivirus5_4 [Solivirus sp.]|uniref:Ankyrin repeat protein n=1 Tax=Solivirus sp. TaxID=2487772 RepID=A0A3G5AFU0_9VIRU|nr:MAG: hypothetical protein Solivirus5_4 [Solivirus sp.]